MAILYRLFFGFSGTNQGWTENHALRSTQTDPTILLPTITALAQARAQFLGVPFVINAVGLRKVWDDVLNVKVRGTVLNRGQWGPIDPLTVGGAEPADVGLIGRWQPDTSAPALAAYAGNVSDTTFGGPPDVNVTLGGVVNQGPIGLGGRFGSFRDAMIQAGAGWLAVTRVADTQITSIVQNVDGTLGFLLLAPGAVAAPLNQVVYVRVRGVSNGQTPIPGAIRVIFTSATHANSVDVIAIARPQLGGFMRTYSNAPTFLPYKGCILQNLVGNHKRGRPFGTPPGRRRRQVRG